MKNKIEDEKNKFQVRIFFYFFTKLLTEIKFKRKTVKGRIYWKYNKSNPAA